LVEELEGELEDLPEEVMQEVEEQETVMSMVEELEENLNNIMNDFEDIDRDIEERIKDLEEEYEEDPDINDKTPVKRNRRQPEYYEPSFKNKSYTNIKGVNKKINIDDKTFAHVMQKIFTQMSFKKGVENYGDRAIEGMTKELRQLHLRDSFIPKHKKDLTAQQWKNKCEAVNLIKEKNDGTIKGRCCADGRQQRQWISKEESASPTAATESVLLTGVIEAKEQRNVITLDVPNAFIQTYLENEKERIILVLRGQAAEILIDIAPTIYKDYAHTEAGKTVLYLECTNVIYGTIKAALLFYQRFRKDIEAKGFIINPYDRCVANKIINGSQMTVLWHVDDLKASHKDMEVLENFVNYLRNIYDDEIGKIKVNKGPRHEFVGMIMDYSKPRKLQVDMKEYIIKLVEDFEGLGYFLKDGIKTPAAEHLFKVNGKCEKLNNKMKEEFHTFVAKALFLCKRGRPDISTAEAFLTTCVMEPDTDDWKKLMRMIAYLKATKDLILTLEADNYNSLKWFIDASYAVHDDMRGHTGGGLTLGKGAVYSRSTKQKINSKSSTETEIIGVDDIVPQILWTNYFMREQGWNIEETVVHQDNKSAILLENNGKLSSSNCTKHINVRYYFIKDCIERKELKVEFCGTDSMWADFYTKPLQGKKFIQFRKTILNLEEEK